MATSLALTSKVDLNWNFQDALDLTTVEDKKAFTIEQAFTNGTGSNQADQMWHDRRRLTPSSPTDDLDLAGVLTNVFGDTVTFVKVKGILIFNKGTRDGTSWTPETGEDLVVGAAASNPLSDLWDAVTASKLKIGSGGKFLIDNPIDGWTVSAGSADVLRVALDGAGEDVDYDIVIWGTTA